MTVRAKSYSGDVRVFMYVNINDEDCVELRIDAHDACGSGCLLYDGTISRLLEGDRDFTPLVTRWQSPDPNELTT